MNTEIPVYHQTGGSNLWSTPLWLIAMVEQLVGPIGLDLAATPKSSHALIHLGPGSVVSEDAFAVEWADVHGVNGRASWLNPPYSRQCLVCDDWVWTPKACAAAGHKSRTKRDWLARARDLGTSEDGRKAPVVLCIPYTPGSGEWLEFVEPPECKKGRRAAQIFTVAGRVAYDTFDEHGRRVGGGASGFTTAIVVYRGPWFTPTARGVIWPPDTDQPPGVSRI